MRSMFTRARARTWGEDEFGHPRFDTQYSALGQLLYRLKYQGNKDALPELVETAASFVRTWNPAVDLLLPVPPSRSRSPQPVLLIAEGLAEQLQVSFSLAAVSRTREIGALKDVNGYDERWRLLAGLHHVDRSQVEGKKILLVDDLFRSGATMNSITTSLYDDGGAAEVFALAITKTRSKQ
jgi:competence protein ComFC